MGGGFMEPVPLSLQNLSVAEGPNYLTACAGPPSRPQRPFCAVCGFPSPYTCVSCGARYCTVRCLGTHQETRLAGNTLRVRTLFLLSPTASQTLSHAGLPMPAGA